MRHVLIILAAVAIILVGAWGTVVLYFDEARLKSLVREEVMRQTGRDLEIRGAMRLRLLPRIAVAAGDVYLSGPPEYEGPGLFEAEHLSLSVSLWSLVRGEFRPGDIGMDNAELRLHTDRAGRSSLAGLYRESRERADTPSATRFSTGHIRIRNVALIMSDAATGATERLWIGLLDLAPFEHDRPVPFVFEGTFGDPPVFDRLAARGRITAPSGRGPALLDGLSVDGTLADSATRFSLSGRAAVDRGPPIGFELSGGQLRLDQGRFGLDLRYTDPGRPMLDAELTGQHLDLDGLLAALSGGIGPAGNGNRDTQPLEVFRDMDLDASLRLDGMRVSALELGDVNAHARARDGVLAIDPLSGELAGGNLEARATVDLTGPVPQVRIQPGFRVERIAQALSAWGFRDILDGSGEFTLDLRARGLDPEQLLASLSGTGSYRVSDGRIRGIDLDALAEGVRAREYAAAAAAAIGGDSLFRELSGALVIEDGRLRMPDVRLTTEHFGLTGNVDVVLSDLGLDGRLHMTGERLERVPLALGGKLGSPRLTPDISEAVRDELGRRLLEGLESRLGREREDPEDDADGDE